MRRFSFLSPRVFFDVSACSSVAAGCLLQRRWRAHPKGHGKALNMLLFLP